MTRRTTMEELDTTREPETETPEILEEICAEELAIDGICGVY
ncbi:MAG: mycofactocin precursor [Deltaproteobacteria bacterium]|nr:mycofactocin precursor [Deltaproteobacteria bacterium]